MTEPETKNSLQQRVDEYLRGKPIGYTIEESEEKTANALLESLQQAENNLHAAQHRVDRLRWELARSHS